MISIDGLAVEFGGTTLFSDVSFVINEKDRIALMGKNGAGKSTLLKILAGVRQPTRGKISAPKDSVIAYLPQHLMTEDGRTVFQETAQAFSHLHEMEATPLYMVPPSIGMRIGDDEIKFLTGFKCPSSVFRIIE